jgi:hypothetical protein
VENVTNPYGVKKGAALESALTVRRNHEPLLSRKESRVHNHKNVIPSA